MPFLRRLRYSYKFKNGDGLDVKPVIFARSDAGGHTNARKYAEEIEYNDIAVKILNYTCNFLCNMLQ